MLVNVKRYRALVDLWYPTDPAIIRRIRDGENMPNKERKIKHINPGDVVSDLPGVSIAGLLLKGMIEEVTDDKAV